MSRTPSLSPQLISIDGAKDKFRKFKHSLGKKVVMETGDDFVSVVGRKVMKGKKFWCQLNTTVKCGEEEALAFLLDVKSRSLLTKRSDESEKAIFEEEDHSRKVKIVEEMVGKSNSRYNLHIMRKMVWKRERSQFILSSTPIRRTDMAAGKDPKTNLQQVEESTFSAVRIIQVNKNESTIEMLVEAPAAPQKRGFRWNGEKIHIEQLKPRFRDIEVDQNEHKQAVKMIQGSYDFRTLSTMQRCFQRWRPLELLDESDGMVMGKMLMENSSRLHNTHERSEKRRRETFKWFFSDFQSMKTLKKKSPWFEAMMEVIIIESNGIFKTKECGKRDIIKMR